MQQSSFAWILTVAIGSVALVLVGCGSEESPVVGQRHENPSASRAGAPLSVGLVNTCTWTGDTIIVETSRTYPFTVLGKSPIKQRWSQPDSTRTGYETHECIDDTARAYFCIANRFWWSDTKCDFGCARGSCKKTPHYLRFYHLNYGTDVDVSEPLMGGQAATGMDTGAEFAVAHPSQGTDLVAYVDIQTIHGHWDFYADPNDEYFVGKYLVALPLSDALALFGGKEKIRQDVVQRADVQALYRQTHAGELPYGVDLDDDGNVAIVGDQAVATLGVPQYRSGESMVLPVPYSYAKHPTRLFFNMANATVRDYLSQYSQRIAAELGTSRIFIDNVNARPHIGTWLSGVTPDDKSRGYVQNYDRILGTLKSAGYGLILNHLRHDAPENRPFTLHLLQAGNFDGLMAENAHGCSDGPPNSGDCPLADPREYLGWANSLETRDKTLLFAAGTSNLKARDPNPYRFWLWVHLVAQDNTFLYINDGYVTPMIHYGFYDESLGSPLSDQPIEVAEVWTRAYQNGTLVFDTNSGDIQWLGR
jgi:hypothetical protein